MHADHSSETTTGIPPVLHQVGPKYGVRDFLRQTEKAWSGIDGLMPWMDVTMECQKKRMRPEAAADAITASLLEGHQGPGVIAMERSAGRRMGKPIVELTSYVGCGAMMHGIDDDGADVRTDEILDMQRSVLRIEPDRTVWTLASAHMAMTRHALERIYERENVSTGRLIHTVRTATMDMVRNMSVAESARLHLGFMPVMDHGGDDAGEESATFLIPMGTGLLITETRMCLSVSKYGKNAKAEFKKHGAVMKASRPSARHSTTIDVGEGRTGLVEMCHVGKTYLSEDILRPEQIRYRDLFRDACSQLDTSAICLEMFGSRDAHRKDHEIEQLPMPHLDELRDLLRNCARHQVPRHKLWGWTATLGRKDLAELSAQASRIPADEAMRDMRAGSNPDLDGSS